MRFHATLNYCNAADNAKHDFFCKRELMLSVFSAINIFSEIRDGTKEGMQEKREIDMTDEDREDFKNATRCFMWRWIQKVLTDSKKKLRNTKKSEIRGVSPSRYPSHKYQKVRNRCHSTGRCRGCVDSICIFFAFRQKYFKIPEVFHNMKKLRWAFGNTECWKGKQSEKDRCYSTELWKVYQHRIW